MGNYELRLADLQQSEELDFVKQKLAEVVKKLRKMSPLAPACFK